MTCSEKGETYFDLPQSAARVLQVPDVVQGDKLDGGFWYGPQLEGKTVPSSSDESRRSCGKDGSNRNTPNGDLNEDGGRPENTMVKTKESNCSSLRKSDQRLIAATHLCAFLRRVIYRKTGLSSSGGVAGCKMLAKLMVNENKPAGRSILFPCSVG